MSDAEVESYLGVVLQLAGARQKKNSETTTQHFIGRRRKKPKK